MDRYLRPDKFDADLNAPNAAKQWNHWLRTFSAFLKRVNSDPSDQLDMLVNFLSPTVYEHIADCSSFDTAISHLHSLYVRPKNVVFARYLLSTCKQECGQNIDQFVQKIKSLARDCNFRPVSAEEYNDDAMRDALITGLQRHDIRTRLLEQHDLNFQTAYDMARSLEIAQKQSQSYCADSRPCASTNAIPSSSPPSSSEKPEPMLSVVSKVTCYFCGYSKHPRTKCPAREAICKNCGKTGHFQRVCRSNNSRSVTSAVGPLVSSVLMAAVAPCLSRTTTKIFVNDVQLHALIDTGSSDSYVSQSVVNTHHWKVHPCDSRITMASTSLSYFL